MGAFNSIKMGQKCRNWAVESDAPVRACAISRDTSIEGVHGQPWIVNAATANRLQHVERESAVVLDGGPRWVLSTTLGFLTGGPLFTGVYLAAFVLIYSIMFTHTANPPWMPRSDHLADTAEGTPPPDNVSAGTDDIPPAESSTGELAGIIAYMVLATALSVASVLDTNVPAGDSEWAGFTSGLLVEMLLCFTLLESVRIVHSFFGDFFSDNASLLQSLDCGQWIVPAVIWKYASQLREQAIQAVRTKLAGLWCRHPMGSRGVDEGQYHNLWDDWSEYVKRNARRVGGYNLLGFSASDVKNLKASFPSQKASKVIERLGSSLVQDSNSTEEWIDRSNEIKLGYDARLRITGPEDEGNIIRLEKVKGHIETLLRTGADVRVDSFQAKIESSDLKTQYGTEFLTVLPKWFYAGALLADSDRRARRAESSGKYGPRFAVSISVLASGTDPLARLNCYPASRFEESSVEPLKSAISMSAKALVSELAASAEVAFESDLLGEKRGVAYATGDPSSLSYTPDEMTSACHLGETLVITDQTFSVDSNEIVFKSLWSESGRVEKRVDVSDFLPPATSKNEEGIVLAGKSACLGWLCHFGFTLAILFAHLFGSASTALVVIMLVAIPATDKRVSTHIDNHFHMVYTGIILNARFLSRWASLSPRGQASVDKAKRVREIGFVLVNILPFVACYAFSGWRWWIAFIPCVVANVPGLCNTIRMEWASAFNYKWVSWHVLNRWYLGRGYLKVPDLRMRLGRNVLVVSVKNDANANVEQVTPPRGLEISDAKYLVVGGGRWTT
ncbi:unnamed protein product [Pylaiella littoralis]